MNSLFWFLSGFFLSKSQKKPLESLSKRLSRIYPLYVFYVLIWTIFNSVSKNHLLTSLMLIAGKPMFFPLWSVFTELPVLIVAMFAIGVSNAFSSTLASICIIAACIALRYSLSLLWELGCRYQPFAIQSEFSTWADEPASPCVTSSLPVTQAYSPTICKDISVNIFHALKTPYYSNLVLAYFYSA